MGLTADRLIESGHIRRDSHPADRRKVTLRYSESGLDTARSFFNPLGMYTHAALNDLPDADLAAAHRVFAALIAAMRSLQTDRAPPGPNPYVPPLSAATNPCGSATVTVRAEWSRIPMTRWMRGSK